jgi:hypothetical protein
MARGKRAEKNGEAKKAKPGPGHNSELNDDQRQGLHYQHCREYEVALAAKKKADADIKNCGKRIKAEGDSVAKVKKTLKSRTPEGEAELRAEIAETAEVLRWGGVNVGHTKEMFPEDRTPGTEAAYAEGKRHGLDGKPGQPPHDPSTEQYREWLRGHGDGQAVLMKGFKPLPTAEDAAGAAAAAGDEHIANLSAKLGDAAPTFTQQQ